MEDFDEMLKVVCNHYDCELTESWGKADYYFYSESTADCYTIYVATDNPDRISLANDIHYYTYDLGEKLKGMLREGLRVYVEDMNEYYVEDTISELYEEITDGEEEEDEE